MEGREGENMHKTKWRITSKAEVGGPVDNDSIDVSTVSQRPLHYLGQIKCSTRHV